MSGDGRGRRSLRICVLTPAQVASNPRVVKEAQALHDAGHRVTVIATRRLDDLEGRDQAVIATADFEIRRIDLRGEVSWKIRRALQIAAASAHRATGWTRAGALGQSPVTPALTLAAMRTPADLYIAHYPAALPAAAAAARRHRAPYAYDAEDFHLGDWPDDAHRGKRELVRAVEGRRLGGCAFVTASSSGIADAYADAYGLARPHVVLNAFPVSRGAPAPTDHGSARPGPSLYWFSQTIGPDRGLDCALEAIAKAETQPHLYLRGHARPDFTRRLFARARDLGVEDRLHTLPPDAPDAMERLAADHDLGLCGEPGHTANNRIALSNKLFSFLLAGLPPLLSDTPGQSAFAREAGLSDQLFPVDDPTALAGLIDGLLASPDRLRAARRRAWRLGRDRYNWERESEGLLALVDGIASSLGHDGRPA